MNRRKQQLINEIADRVADILLQESRPNVDSLIEYIYLDLNKSIDDTASDIIKKVRPEDPLYSDLLEAPTDNYYEGYITFLEWCHRVRNFVDRKSYLLIGDAKNDIMTRWQKGLHILESPHSGMGSTFSDSHGLTDRVLQDKDVNMHVENRDVDSWMTAVGNILKIRTFNPN